VSVRVGKYCLRKRGLKYISLVDCIPMIAMPLAEDVYRCSDILDIDDRGSAGFGRSLACASEHVLEISFSGRRHSLRIRCDCHDDAADFSNSSQQGDSSADQDRAINNEGIVTHVNTPVLFETVIDCH
jgi:hypothetical protein